MKRDIFSLAGFLCLAVISCKKPGVHEETVPAPIHFEVLDKSGNSLVHSIKDALVVSYTMNGTQVSSPLTIYKVQVSSTDTMSVDEYNGFVITDLDPATHQGYISSPSAAGVRNFSLSLNGRNIGTIYLDYWGYMALSYPPPASSAFTFDGAVVKSATLSGAYSNGTSVVSANGTGSDVIELLQAQ
ncbi:MAG: hypothetical protein JST19_11720 [Bacteroidetes bacterium]|nr:hypothetical protein [Bacteroidota bacterium]